MNKILWCYESNESSSAVLSQGTIYLVCSSNFFFFFLNRLVLPFKWNPFSSTFTWCCLLSTYSSNCWVCGWNPMVLPSKWNPFSSTFIWNYFFLHILQKETWFFLVNFFLWNLQRTLTGLRTNSASQARAGFENIIITNNDSQNLLLSQQSIKVGLIKFIMFISFNKIIKLKLRNNYFSLT